MTAQKNVFLFTYIDPSLSGFLESLPSCHQYDCAHSEVLYQLKTTIERNPQMTKNYLPQIAIYLQRNLQRNLALINTLECLVSLHELFPLSFRSSFSELLKDKYPWTDFSHQVNKLKAINRSLIEPFFNLLAKLAEWHQFQIEKLFFNEAKCFQVNFLLEYLHVLVKFEFETGSYLQGIDPCQTILILYNLFTDHPHILHSEIKHQQLQKFAYSLFYYLTTFQLDDYKKMKVIFDVIGYFKRLLADFNIKLDDNIVSKLIPMFRKCEMEKDRRDQLMGAIFDGVRGLLVIDWSLNSQLEWSWKMKIIYDLLGVESRQQVDLIKELTNTSRQIVKQLSLT